MCLPESNGCHYLLRMFTEEMSGSHRLTSHRHTRQLGERERGGEKMEKFDAQNATITAVVNSEILEGLRFWQECIRGYEVLGYF